MTKMIDLFKTAAAGIGKAIARGGDDVAKIETKLGGSGKLSSMFKSLSGAIEEFIKRLGVIKEGIKHYGGKLSPANIKDVLTRAFQSSKDKLDDGVAYYKGAKTAAATEGKSLASFMTKKGVTAAKTKFTSIVGSSFKKINSWLVSFMTKNPELLSKFVGKEMVSKTGLTYTFKGMDDAGNFILKTNKQGVAAAKGIVKQNKVALSAEKQIYKGYGKAVAKTADENLAVVMKSQTAAKKALEKKIQKQVYDKQRTKAFKDASATGKKEMIQNVRGAGRKKLAALNKQNKETIKQIKGLNKADAARQQSMISQQTVSAAKGTAAKNAAAMAKGTKEFADVPVSAAQFFSCYGHMWFGVAKTGVKKATGVAMPEFDQFLIYLTHLYPPKQAAADIARIVAASQGGGFDDFDAEAYKSPIRSNRRKRPGEEGYKSVSDKLGSVMSAAGLDESLYLDEIIWESNLRRKMLKEQKLISFIH